MARSAAAIKELFATHANLLGVWPPLETFGNWPEDTFYGFVEFIYDQVRRPRRASCCTNRQGSDCWAPLRWQMSKSLARLKTGPSSLESISALMSAGASQRLCRISSAVLTLFLRRPRGDGHRHCLPRSTPRS